MNTPRVVTAQARRSALAIAFIADAIQLAVMPLFGAGWLAPTSDALDVIVAFLLIRRLGWHIAFLPSFVVEILPVVDLFPTWTAAAWFVGRQRAAAAPEIAEVRGESM
jgi:hypothetical protein